MKPETKIKRYERIYAQLQDLLQKSDNAQSRMCTITAILHHKMESFFWTGFYMLTDGELLVSNYQGPVACMHLAKNKGVCWAGVNNKETVVVGNVEEFPGHIACSSLSKSEIVVPVIHNGTVTGVLDVDSKDMNTFDDIDKEYLEKIVSLIYE